MFLIPVHENLSINSPGRQGAGGEESRVSVAARAGCDSKQTRLVVAYHPRAFPCTCPSAKSSRGHSESCGCMKSLGRASGVPGKPGAALWAHPG